MLPEDFWLRLSDIENGIERSLPKYLAPFCSGFDLPGDGSILAVPLPGHSAGHIGLWIADADGQGVFLVADACWSLPACREGRLPMSFMNMFTNNPGQYRETFSKLSVLINREPWLHILPSHCAESRGRLLDESS
jgi:glyoxylase-like metal-dependent hydrolase (beta-lactamase superfamily II)